MGETGEWMRALFNPRQTAGGTPFSGTPSASTRLGPFAFVMGTDIRRIRPDLYISFLPRGCRAGEVRPGAPGGGG